MKNFYKLLGAFLVCIPLSTFGQTYTFTSAGVTGRVGPTQAQVNTAYSATNLNGMVTVTTQGIQEWIVPSTGNYSIEAHGASGGSHASYSGHGANIYGEVYLTAGTTLYILVGQMGSQYASNNVDGGGGGTFITDGTNLLIAAGGGGGSSQNVNTDQDASLTSTVVNGTETQFGSAAAGYSANGVHFYYSTYTTVAQSFTNGGEGQAGGQAGGWPGAGYGDGGFGGGGSSCSCSTGGGGGGGGYTGGGGGAGTVGGPFYSGFGGSSFTIPSATNVTSVVLPGLGDGQVIINQLCTPLTVNATASSLCESEMLVLSATSSNAGTISWDNGVADGVPFMPPVGTTTYTPTSTHPDDCPYSIDITVHALPTVDAGNDVDLCNNGATVTLMGSGNAHDYVWDNGVMDGVSFVPPGGVTTYTLTGMDTVTGCQNTDMVDVNVSSSMIVAGNTVNETYGNDGTIDISIIGGTPPYTYAWDNGLGSIEDPSGLTPGTYIVTVTDSLGCTEMGAFVINSVVGVDELEMSLSANPNPTTGDLNVSLDGVFEYSVYNMLGQQISSGTATDEVIVDLSRVENGTYILKVVNQMSTYSLPIVKK